MLTFINFLKGLATVQSGLIVLLILSFILNRYQKKMLAKFFLGFSVLLFLLCSTSYLPNYFADKLETKYLPFNPMVNKIDTGKVLIHVLGSGNTLDDRLPANEQLGLTALGRLVEGIRIHRMIKNSVIVCSGYSSLGLETQAEVTKRAAIVLGVEVDKLETLDTPSTTQEEAKALSMQYDTTTQLIVVTDALHMPRAIKLFKAAGFNPIAAPTNYKINHGPSLHKIGWWPSMGNIALMDYVIHESLGNLKASFFK